jgi:peptidoglycan biosynthesis protein MviN/MurJ (putative lipid II flippase)
MANAIAAAVDLGLAAALVPSLDARGAAVANGVGQAVYALIVLVAASRLLAAPVEWRLGALARNLVAAGVAGFAGWAALQWLDGFSGLAVAAAALTVAYAALTVALRVLPADDAAWLEETLGNRFVTRVTRLCASRR